MTFFSHFSHRLTAALAAAVITMVGLLGPASPAEAKAKSGPGNAPAGYDISYPQCGSSYPASVTLGIVGVNDGIVLSPNPCLASELGWARNAGNHAPGFYANTGDPGPAYSSHWPKGQQTPQVCDGSNSAACSYDYGWNAAQDSFADAVGAASADGSTSPVAYVAAAPWWLDVETGNSWQALEALYGATSSSYTNDQSALQGEVAFLTSQSVTSVGMYSTGSQWASVTGGTGAAFASSPAWLAGYSRLGSAQSACSTTSFTGGRVALTQYPSGGFDADYACP